MQFPRSAMLKQPAEIVWLRWQSDAERCDSCGTACGVWRDSNAPRKGSKTQVRHGHGHGRVANRGIGSSMDARCRHRAGVPDRDRELIRSYLQRLPQYSVDAALRQVRAHRPDRIWGDELAHPDAAAAAPA